MPTPLELLPCLDDDALGRERRRDLVLPRERAIELARSAVEACQRGHYLDERGARVDWSGAVARARASRASVPVGAPPGPPGGPVARAVVAEPSASARRTRVQVTNETTMGAGKRFFDRGARPIALNFANGVHAGGGFLRGALAQEEALCRSSALFVTLDGDPMYAAHAAMRDQASTDACVVSPDVPFFRLDDGRALERPWAMGVITCAAPYAVEVGIARSTALMAPRIARVLEICSAWGYTSLVLGAWGCGAFGNDTVAVAKLFREALEGPFSDAFDEVVFAIADWSDDRRFLGPFRDVFAR